MFKSKKAFITHPVAVAVIAFLLGALLMYLIAKGTIPIGLNVC